MTFTTTQARTKPVRSTDLIVHEWGTFTSIAGQDGRAVEWLPLEGPSDLPCFVDRYRFNVKGYLTGTVRMETPVLYFYASQDTTVNVSVQFRQGLVTEWFPRALVTPANATGTNLRRPDLYGTIAWTDVKVSPGAPERFPVDGSSSHYYAARHTDAAPLQSATDKAESEKFLFYRGVGGFEPPLTAKVVDDGTVVVKDSAGDPIGDLMLFENHGGRIAYQVGHQGSGEASLKPSATSGLAPPRAALEQMLIAHGLFPKEAKAMIETWRDSWFEEGTRLIYIVRRDAIDAILPLQIRPVPTAVARVFVGHLELITPSIEREVKNALATNDRGTLEKHGRFLRPIASRILAEAPAADRARIQAMLQAVYASWPSPPGGCN